MTSFYNDNAPFAVEWLRNLIRDGVIDDGVVDSRSVTEVSAADILGFRQCHFFGGIAGWAEAFRIAGLSGIKGVWSASMPCQPISGAGKRGGEKDKRHLWPEFYPLVSECRPSIMFGEQSGSKDGREWIDGVSLDLEELGYVVGSSDLCAAGIGAPHIRQRIYWGAVRLADTGSSECDWWNQSVWQHWRALYASDGSDHGRLANSEHDAGCSKHVNEQGRRAPSATDSTECSGSDDGMGDTTCDNERRDQLRRAGPSFGIAIGGSGSGMVDAISQGLEGYAGNGYRGSEPGRIEPGETGPTSTSDPWGDWYPVFCRDGKTRRVGRAVQPLAHGVPRNLGSLQSALEGMGLDAKRAKAMRKWAGSRLAKAGRNRVGRLQCFGNAIVPPLAAQFIQLFLKSFFESIHCERKPINAVK